MLEVYSKSGIECWKCIARQGKNRMLEDVNAWNMSLIIELMSSGNDVKGNDVQIKNGMSKSFFARNGVRKRTK